MRYSSQEYPKLLGDAKHFLYILDEFTPVGHKDFRPFVSVYQEYILRHQYHVLKFDAKTRRQRIDLAKNMSARVNKIQAALAGITVMTAPNKPVSSGDFIAAYNSFRWAIAESYSGRTVPPRIKWYIKFGWKLYGTFMNRQYFDLQTLVRLMRHLLEEALVYINTDPRTVKNIKEELLRNSAKAMAEFAVNLDNESN